MHRNRRERSWAVCNLALWDYHFNKLGLLLSLCRDATTEEIWVCVPEDRTAEPVRRFETFTADLHRLADWLESCGVTIVAMESTGVYWIAIYEILEARGIAVCLVNAQATKNVSGLMCLGIAALHRISRIIIACPDPNGGTTNLALSSVGSVYQRWWPAIQLGLCQEQACDLIIAFLKTKKFSSWEAMLGEFEIMKQAWVRGYGKMG